MRSMKAIYLKSWSGRWHPTVLGLLIVLASSSGGVAGSCNASMSRPMLPSSVSIPQVRPAFGGILMGKTWLGDLMSKFETWLTNRSHMIQFGAIAMIIALFIIWWRKT